MQALGRRVDDAWASAMPLWRDNTAQEYGAMAIGPLRRSIEEVASAAFAFAAAVRAARASANQ